MTVFSSEDYVFKKMSEGVYIRKAFGIEVTGCKMADLCEGFTHLTVSAAVKINGLTSQSARAMLEPRARAAWTAMRHQVPGIACKCFKLPLPDESYAFRYSVPSSTEDVQEWLKETVHCSDNVMSMRDAYRLLKDSHWWFPSSDHYVAELHISPSMDGWNFSLSLLHSFFDGRAGFAIMEVYLDFLTAEVQGRAKPVSSIEWGSETLRLQPAAPFIPSIVKSGCPPEVSAPSAAPVKTSDSKTEEEVKPVVVIPWLYAPGFVGGHGNISRDITFSREITEKLHATAKMHGYTITQLFTALYILAHIEAEFRTAEIRGMERFRELSATFKEATHYLIAWTFINHRHKFPGGYDSFKSQAGSPLLAQDGTSPVLPMDVVRLMFKLDETNMSVKKIPDSHAFWDGLVAAVATAWKGIDQSLEAYLARATDAHFASQKFDPAAFHIPALIISSIGDLGRLGMLTDYHPGSLGESVKQALTLTVEDIITGLRCTIAPIVDLLYQYNGRLSCHFGTSGEYTSEETLQLKVDVFQEWVNVLIDGL